MTRSDPARGRGQGWSAGKSRGGRLICRDDHETGTRKARVGQSRGERQHREHRVSSSFPAPRWRGPELALNPTTWCVQGTPSRPGSCRGFVGPVPPPLWMIREKPYKTSGAAWEPHPAREGGGSGRRRCGRGANGIRSRGGSRVGHEVSTRRQAGSCRIHRSTEPPALDLRWPTARRPGFRHGHGPRRRQGQAMGEGPDAPGGPGYRRRGDGGRVPARLLSKELDHRADWSAHFRRNLGREPRATVAP